MRAVQDDSGFELRVHVEQRDRCTIPDISGVAHVISSRSDWGFSTWVLLVP